MDTAIIHRHALSAAERQRLGHAVVSVCARHPWVAVVYHYGSTVTEGHPGRDIDLGVVAEPIPAWGSEAGLAMAVADESTVRAIPLDVRIINSAGPMFWNSLLSNHRVLYQSSDRARLAFEVRAMAQWLDFKPVWERAQARYLSSRAMAAGEGRHG